MDLELLEEIGRTAGFTSKRPPRNYRGIYTERDGADAGLHGEATRSAYQRLEADRRGPATYQRSVVLACVRVSASPDAWSIIRPYPEDKNVVTARSVRGIYNFL